MKTFAALFLLALASFGQARSVAVISHRGEHLRNPENTLAAYRTALDLGADYFEVDVQTTADGKLVLMHDSQVDRTTGGKGQVSELTFDQIRALKAGGEQVPTFEEALALARTRKAKIYVDVKRATQVDVLAALDKHQMVDQVVVYGSFAYLQRLQQLRPGIRIMPESVNTTVVQRIVDELKAKVIAFSARDWQDDIIKIARDAGADIYVDRLGSADNPAAWQDAIDRGATGIQTDRPGELVLYLRSKGLHQ